MREEGERLSPRTAERPASLLRIGDNRITRKFWHGKRPASLLPLDCDSCTAHGTGTGGGAGGRGPGTGTLEGRLQKAPKRSPFYARAVIRTENISLMTDLAG